MAEKNSSNTASLNATRAAFMRRASAPDINALALKLAYLIAYKYMDRETGTTFRSQDTLARDLKASVRTVQRLLDILRPLGLVIVPGHGPGRAATYWIDPDKATPVSPINTTPVSPIGGRKGDNRRQRTRQPATEKATPVSPPLKKNLQEDSPREEYISEPPDFASPDSKQDATPNPDRKTGHENGDNITFSDSDLDSAFDEFWAICPPKQGGKVKARKAYDMVVVKRAVPPDKINAAMKRYTADTALKLDAAKQAGRAPPFIKHPTNWLIDGCYDDEVAPTGPVIDQDGNEITEPQPRRWQRPETHEEMVDRLVAEAEQQQRERES